MDRAALDASIDTVFDDARADNSLTPSMEGTEIKKVADYVDQQAPIKTADAITLSATPQVLPYDVNSCNFTGGKAYLPTTTVIGKEVYVIASSANIEIRANVANTSKMFVNFGSFIPYVTLTINQMYRFIYIGFDTEGYWKAELI